MLAPMITAMQLKSVRTGAGLTVLAAAIGIVAPLAGAHVPELLASAPARAVLFYAVTAAAYALLPYQRRTDIALVAMWLVLAVGVAPCFGGREISAVNMFADMAGVALAALPVFIARFRQVLQGDFRPGRRRGTDAA